MMSKFAILRQVINISRGDYHSLPPEVEAIVGEILERHAEKGTPYLVPQEVRESTVLRACLERLAGFL